MNRFMKIFLSFQGRRVATLVFMTFAILAVGQGPALAASQENSTDAKGGKDNPATVALEDLKKERAEGRNGFANGVVALDEQTNELVLERIRRYQRHQIAALEHREQVFHWQLISNKVSFVVVLVLVFAGITFSAIQFWKSMQMPAEKFADAADTEFSAGTGGITVRSSVLGVIVLVISLAFFYLYLVHVFPIEELEPVRDSQAEVT